MCTISTPHHFHSISRASTPSQAADKTVLPQTWLGRACGPGCSQARA